MATVEQVAPSPAAPIVPPTSGPTAPAMATRQDSMMTVDMHIPGAWNGTNPSTPQPISEDMKYFGQTLKTVPGTVQSYMPPKESVAATGSTILNKAATGSTILNKAAAMVPASVMNTATNVLPKSMQPTMNPTAADAKPPAHPTDLSNERPVTTTTNTIIHKELDPPKDRAAPAGTTLQEKVVGILPASVVGAAASYLPVSMGGKTAPSDSAPTALDTHATKRLGDEPTVLQDTKATTQPATTGSDQTGTTWTDTAKSVLPLGALGAAAAYLPSALQPNSASDEKQGTQVPVGADAPAAISHDATSTSETSNPSGSLVGSTVSPDQDVQEALSKAANPDQYKSKVVPPMHSYPSAAPSVPPKDDQMSLDSTQAIGGTTPMTLNSVEAEGDGYPEKNKKGVSGLAAMAAGGGIAAAAGHHDSKFKESAGDEYTDQSQKGIPCVDATPLGSSTHPRANNYTSQGQENLAGNDHPETKDKDTSRLAAMTAGGGVGAIAVDHGLKDQRDAAVTQHDGSTRLHESSPAQDSFMHVVIPATPGAGLNEQEMSDKKHAKVTGDGTLATPDKLKKKDRSGSVSGGEASPSASPSKSGMFGGIRKLTKKRDRSVSKGHDRKGSVGDAVPPVHGDSLDTKDSNSTGNSPTSAAEEKRERHVLHKDPPPQLAATTRNEGDQTMSPTSATSANEGASTINKRDHDTTPSMLANPFSPSSPPSSPSKVGFREKMKGEFMVVQGKLTRDEGLKEAGEKMKKGTL